MALDESKDNNGNLQQINDINVLYDEQVLEILGNNVPLKIDYYKTQYNEGFTIDNGSHC